MTPGVAVAAACVAVAGMVAVVAMRPLPEGSAAASWPLYVGSGYAVALPTAATTATVPGGSVTTSVVGTTAYTVVTFTTSEAAAVDASQSAVARLDGAVVSVRPGRIGPFSVADIVARLPQAWLHGRVLVAAPRGYLVAELTRTADQPPDLERLLAGFDPVVSPAP